MRSFNVGQRIQVVAGELKWQYGTVRRIRMSDHGAWVEMDTDFPEHMRSFPDPKDERYRYVMLYPDICVAAKGTRR